LWFLWQRIEKNIALFIALSAIFLVFFANFATVKRTLSVRKVPILDAAFMPNLTFLGLLSREMSFGEKPVTHSDSHPASFRRRELQFSALSNKNSRGHHATVSM